MAEAALQEKEMVKKMEDVVLLGADVRARGCSCRCACLSADLAEVPSAFARAEKSIQLADKRRARFHSPDSLLMIIEPSAQLHATPPHSALTHARQS